ncbi:MAG: tryptophan--tRNA ligase, partial [Gammaproteobacteria bacterium]|nr:tryptophan--tRNA ligase [Gammaproteobacteria bacterium]
LVEPEAALSEAAKMPGLDGQKMSKSYGNTISLRDTPEEVEQKVRRMPTDPARVRRDDPGTPEKCPVWELHKVYSDEERQQWVKQGCTSAGIGCIDCKMPVIEAMEKELAPMRERAQEFDSQPDLVQSIIEEGNERAREQARDTLREVRQVMGLV